MSSTRRFLACLAVMGVGMGAAAEAAPAIAISGSAIKGAAEIISGSTKTARSAGEASSEAARAARAAQAAESGAIAREQAGDRAMERIIDGANDLSDIMTPDQSEQDYQPEQREPEQERSWWQKLFGN